MAVRKERESREQREHLIERSLGARKREDSREERNEWKTVGRQDRSRSVRVKKTVTVVGQGSILKATPGYRQEPRNYQYQIQIIGFPTDWPEHQVRRFWRTRGIKLMYVFKSMAVRYIRVPDQVLYR